MAFSSTNNFADHNRTSVKKNVLCYLVSVMESGCGYAATDPSARWGEIFIGPKQINYHNLEIGDQLQCLVTPNQRPNSQTPWFALRTTPTNNCADDPRFAPLFDALDPTPRVVDQATAVSQLQAIVEQPEELVLQNVFPSFEKDELIEAMLVVLNETFEFEGSVNEAGDTMFWTTRQMVDELVDLQHMDNKVEIGKLQGRMCYYLERLLSERKLVVIDIRRIDSVKPHTKLWGLPTAPINIGFA